MMQEATLNTCTLPKSPIWEEIQFFLLKQIGEAPFQRWINKLTLFETGKNHVYFATSTRFTREWVISHYLEQIFTLWKERDPSLQSMDIKIIQDKDHYFSSLPNIVSGVDISGQNIITMDPFLAKTKDFMGSLLDPRFTFDRFIADETNQMALSASLLVANACCSTPSYHNPFYIYGQTGIGKTHLLHAIGWRINQEAPHLKVVYLSAEKFMYQFVKAIRAKDMWAFKEYFRSIDVLIMDDIQFICGKESTQEEFFHTFVTLLDNQKRVIVACDKSPGDLKEMDERVRSRLGGGLAIDIKPSGLTLRKNIIINKSQTLGFTLPNEIIELLAEKISSNIRELEGALHKLAAFHNWSVDPLTPAIINNILKDTLQMALPKLLSIEAIQKKVASFYHIEFSELISTKRSKNMVQARHIAMYLIKKLTTKSLLEIGRSFGNRDHTNVVHSVKRIESLLLDQIDIQKDVKELTFICQQNS